MNTRPRFTAGSGVPLVTPFRDGDVDFDAFADLVEFQIDAGSDALIICGSTGENQALSFDERAQQIELAVKAANGRIAIIAATGGETEADTLALSDRAVDFGADGLLIITPRATPIPQAGVVAYLGAVASRSDLPVYVYNYPARTHVDITAETIERLVHTHPTIVGLKQTDGNLGLVTHVRRRLGPEFAIFCGIEQLALPGLMLGAAGMITASGNIAPRQIVEMYRAFRTGRLAEARDLHAALIELFDAVVQAESSPAAALKYLLRRTGQIPTNEHRLPSLPPSAREQQLLDAALAVANDAVPALS